MESYVYRNDDGELCIPGDVAGCIRAVGCEMCGQLAIDEGEVIVGSNQEVWATRELDQADLVFE